MIPKFRAWDKQRKKMYAGCFYLNNNGMVYLDSVDMSGKIYIYPTNDLELLEVTVYENLEVLEKK